MNYDHQKIEAKWQKFWEQNKTFAADDKDSKREKSYVLDMFPYPSGEGIHVGHPIGYIASDIFARYERMQGKNVLHPMGWDAFGLPAENYALKTGTHPRITTDENTKNMRRQLMNLGLSFDWDREVDTTDPEYYKWTQWIFLQLYKQGLAYEAESPINWCPSCKTGLANEEVINGECDRCGTTVGKKLLRQWLLKITAYAQRLLDDLEGLDWPNKILEMQRNWIGRSEGANVDFAVVDSEEVVKVYTTRIDTIYSGTFLVLAPEHRLLTKLQPQIKNWHDVHEYVEASEKKKEFERTADDIEKTGVELEGLMAINPATKKEIPIWVSDFVLGSYGFGAVFGDAHDTRDLEMAKKYNIHLTVSVMPADKKDLDKIESLEISYTDDGVLFNSGQFDGMTSAKARDAITAWLAKDGKAEKAVNYKLRDWVFSRQRYWGEPIPIIHCEKCGTVPVPEDQLPVLLPDVKKYEPTGTGESPLANIDEWVNTKCPTCDGDAKRETNTMPQWAGSSWYFLRFTDPDNKEEFASKANLKQWMPVDTYVGGAEHAVLHLLYARFWVKALQDAGHLDFSEPFTKLYNQGLILAEDGSKMSKSKGNTVSPDEIVNKNGADTLRIYEMFMGPFEQSKPWSTSSIQGVRRFLQKVWDVQEIPATDAAPEGDVLAMQHKTIKKVGNDIVAFKFNTAVSQLMQFANLLVDQKEIPKETLSVLAQLIAPFAPHLAEEMWNKLGNSESISAVPWPSYDEKLTIEKEVEIPVQINGRVRGKILASPDISEEEIVALAKDHDNVKKNLEGKEIVKVIFVPGKLLSLVIK